MTSSGLHFTLDNLPERYRSQIAQKLSQEQGGITSRPTGSEGQEGGFRSSGDVPEAKDKPKMVCGRVRQRKVGGMPNKTEAAFNRSILDGKGIYEGLTFKVAEGCKYTPDYIVWDSTGKMTAYEVKGSYRLPSQGRARTAFLACREKYPHVIFRWFKLTKAGHFIEELIEG